MKPITVYWCPNTSTDIHPSDWSFLYPKPESLYSMVRSDRKDSAPNNTLLSCPAFSNKTKKILVLKNPMSCSYEYDFTFEHNLIFRPTTEKFINASSVREKALNNGHSIVFDLSYLFFSDEPMDAYFTPPMFNKPKHMKQASLIPGEFDIGRWFRPCTFELQFWDNKGTFDLEENEPMAYIEFKTDRPVILKRFNINKALYGYAEACVEVTNLFGRGQSLLDRYNRFKNIGMREKILTEIKNNLVDENPIKL